MAAKFILQFGLGPTGFIAQIITSIVMRIGAEIISELDEYIDLKAVVLRNEVHRSAFNNAGIALKQLASQVDINSEEFKNERTKLGNSLADIVAVNRV